MQLGRLDAETTANVGTIRGGTATNVVPERCEIEAEVRAIDEARVEQVVTEIIDHLQDGADATECDLDVTVERMFKGYRPKGRSPEIALGRARAARPAATSRARSSPAVARTPTRLRAAGFPCTNLANGTERNHEPGERVSVDALEGMLEVAIALVDEARACRSERST